MEHNSDHTTLADTNCPVFQDAKEEIEHKPSLYGRITGGEAQKKNESLADEVCGDISSAGHSIAHGVGRAATAIGNKYSDMTAKSEK